MYSLPFVLAACIFFKLNFVVSVLRHALPGDQKSYKFIQFCGQHSCFKHIWKVEQLLKAAPSRKAHVTSIKKQYQMRACWGLHAATYILLQSRNVLWNLERLWQKRQLGGRQNVLLRYVSKPRNMVNLYQGIERKEQQTPKRKAQLLQLGTFPVKFRSELFDHPPSFSCLSGLQAARNFSSEHFLPRTWQPHREVHILLTNRVHRPCACTCNLPQSNTLRVFYPTEWFFTKTGQHQ